MAIFSEEGARILAPSQIEKRGLHLKELPPGWEERLKRNKIIWTRGEKELRERLKIENILLVPIFEKGLWRGFLALGSRTPRACWSPRVISILNSISYVIGSSLYQEKLERLRSQKESLAQATITSQELAHHFKNLLQIILAQAEKGLQSSGEKDKNRALKNILKTTEEASEISKKVMQHNGEEEVPLASLLENLVKQYQEITPAGVSLRLEIKRRPVVKGALPLLREIFRELLINSLKAVGEEGLISLCLDKENEQALISIRDSGPGIPEFHHEQIFEEGFSTKKGKGLGLAGAKRYLKSLKGEIRLKKTTQGAHFEIRLPAAKKRENSFNSKGTCVKEKVIFLVEDEPLIRSALQERLKKEGFVIEAFSGFEETLKRSENVFRLDLLITDISLPDGKGTKLVRLLKERFSNLRVLFVSGLPLEKEEFFKENASFLKKPFSFEKLLNEVHKILS